MTAAVCALLRLAAVLSPVVAPLLVAEAVADDALADLSPPFRAGGRGSLPVPERPDVPMAEVSFASAKVDAKAWSADSIALMSSSEFVVPVVALVEAEDAAMLVMPSAPVAAVRDEKKSEVLESVLVAVEADDVEADDGPPAPCAP